MEIMDRNGKVCGVREKYEGRKKERSMKQTNGEKCMKTSEDMYRNNDTEILWDVQYYKWEVRTALFRFHNQKASPTTRERKTTTTNCHKRKEHFTN